MYGVTDGCLQCRLLTEPELTLKDAVKIAIAQETAEKGAQQCSSNSDHSHQPYTRLARQMNSHIDHLQKKLYATDGVVTIMDHWTVVLKMRSATLAERRDI